MRGARGEAPPQTPRPAIRSRLHHRLKARGGPGRTCGAGQSALWRPLPTPETRACPAPCLAPRLRAAHARGEAFRRRRDRGSSAAARSSAPHSCWAAATRPRSGAPARRRPRPGRPVRLRRPGGWARSGWAGGGARRWPAARRPRGQPVSRSATFPVARSGTGGGLGPGARRWEAPSVEPRGVRGREAGWARGVRGGLRRSCPCVPAAPARLSRVSGRGRGAGAELVVS